MARSIEQRPNTRKRALSAPDAVVIDTALRFKGLERPWVVLIDVDEMASPEGRTRAFIGITRATMGLVLVVR